MANKKKKKVSKSRAGAILSGMLRSIAEEKTEMVTIDGEDKMVTKAEALARLAWRHALGFTEQKVINGQLTDIEHSPDRVYVAMIWDRLEGKVAIAGDGKKEKRTVADKVGDQSKNRLNKLAQESAE